MYLKFLSENEKPIFLNLVYAISLADGDYGIEERVMLESYCQEMELVNPEINSIVSVDLLIKELNRLSNEQSKKIIVFEALGVALTDGVYDKREKMIIDNLAETFGLNKEYSKQCEEVISRYLALQQDMNDLVIS